ncbi:hypothetical protein [Ralstonia sp. ASV6]|uniref:hypothetical protein n=1 Tax=Ralstonia sp. ASV6 TaxID=2795124 RepID=UPI0018ECB114|nr:hypothetical protein [Ralstonia sp. ASV6]
MWVQEPEKLMAVSEEHYFDAGQGLMHLQKSRMEFALKHVNAVPSEETLTEALDFVSEATGIALDPSQLQAILSLYPIERGKLADYGWGDTEVADLTLDVIAHFFLSTRWPLGMDNVDIDAFVQRLRKAATFMGYRLA